MAFALAVLMLIGLAHPAAGQSAVQLKDVQVEQQTDSVTVKLWTTGTPNYSASLIDTPTRLVIDLTGTAYAWDKSRVNPDVAPIREIRGSQWKVGTARIVLELTRKVGYRIEPSAEGLSIILEPSATAVSEDAPKPTASKPAPKAVARPDVAKAETPKADAAKSEARKDIGRIDAPKAPETSKAEPVKKDVVRAETPKVEPVKVEPVKKEVARAETPKAEPTKVEVPKPVAKAEVPKVEVAKADAPKAEARVEPAPVVVTPPPAIVAQATVTPTPPPANGGRLLSMDFKDADVINLLRILAAESGRNIVAGDDVKGKVSISLRNVTWEQALDTILEVKGLQKIEKGNVIRIVSTEQLTKEREAEARVNEAKLKAEIDTRTKLAEAQIREQDLAARRIANEAAAEEARSRGPLREETVRLSYADPEEVAKTLQGILGIPPEGTSPVSGTIPSVPPVIGSGPNLLLPNQPPFSALYGPGQPPAPVVSISQDVLAKGITIRAHKPTNTIFIRHYQADLERIKKLIREQLDIPLPQVKIEARMEILDRTALEAIGVQWGGAAAGNAGHTTLVGQGFQSAPSAVPGMTLPAVGGVLQPDGSTVVTAPTGVQGVTSRNTDLTLSRLLPVDRLTGLPIGGNLVNIPFQSLPNASSFSPAGGIAFGIVGTNFNINLALQALENQGKTRTLARPEIVTVENNKAEVSLGEEIPYATVSSAGTQIQFKEAVLKLTVTPTVTREKINNEEITKIKMVVVVENNSRGDTITPAAGVSVPIINRRKAETQVLMREGERLVIGGVTQSVQQNTVRKVPLFGDIPLLGWLFKARETFESGRELVVFLTPSLVRTDGALAVRPASGK